MGRVSFLHNSKYGTMFWIHAINCADSIAMFSLLLSSAYTAPGIFLLLTPMHQHAGWGCTRGQETTQLGWLCPADQSVPYHAAQHIKQGEGRAPLSSRWAYLPWEVLDEFLVWLCLCTSLLLCLIKLSLSQPTSFLIFTLLLHTSLTPRQSEWAVVRGSVAGWG